MSFASRRFFKRFSLSRRSVPVSPSFFRASLRFWNFVILKIRFVAPADRLPGIGFRRAVQGEDGSAVHMLDVAGIKSNVQRESSGYIEDRIGSARVEHRSPEHIHFFTG